jgi:hypothetical protein
MPNPDRKAATASALVQQAIRAKAKDRAELAARRADLTSEAFARLEREIDAKYNPDIAAYEQQLREAQAEAAAAVAAADPALIRVRAALADPVGAQARRQIVADLEPDQVLVLAREASAKKDAATLYAIGADVARRSGAFVRFDAELRSLMEAATPAYTEAVRVLETVRREQEEAMLAVSAASSPVGLADPGMLIATGLRRSPASGGIDPTPPVAA